MVRKIAILGGGASSLFAAWELVKADRAAYDITVYQVGWRLGGKGASGRREGDDRIEEHGLHLMFGFYENVFRMVREAYVAAYADPERWKRFFKSQDTTVSMIQYLDRERSRWENWDVPYPTGGAPGLPGDAGGPDNSVLSILENVWSWLKALATHGAAEHGLDLDTLTDSFPAQPLTLDELRQRIDNLAAPPTVDRLHDLVAQRASGLADAVLEPLVPDYWALATHFVGKLDDHLADAADVQAADGRRFDTLLQHAGELIWRRAPPGLGALVRFVAALARGVFVDLLLKPKTAEGERDWFLLDEYDFRAWVTRHGGDENAPPVDGLYDAVFAAYSQLGAGAIVQAALKAAFLYRGAAVYKMQAGMGDTIFTPLYLALKAAGVKFEFFHRVVELTTGANAGAVESIVFERQVAPGALDPAGYDPLREVAVDLGGPLTLKCWPSEPIWARIAEPERARVKAGPDLENYWTEPDPGRRYPIHRVDGAAGAGQFNDVILGISVAALPDICAALLDADQPFRVHVDYLAKASTATQAMQLWTVPGKEPKQPNPIIVPNGTPYDTIADMSHLLRAERHPANTVGAISYLCSALFEPQPPSPRSATDYPKALLSAAVANGKEWVTSRAPVLWRNLAIGGQFDWAALSDRNAGVGPARFDAQYVNAPNNLSDRYVLSPPMTYAYRLMANGTRYSNLYLTGDWIKTSLSIGCLEAAAMAGIQTARALARERAGKEVPRAYGDWIPDIVARVPPAPAGALPARAVVAAPSRPLYRVRDSELIGPPPYELLSENLFLFVLPADQAKLQKMCDDDLNLGTTRYSPIADYVVLYATKLTNRSLGTTCLSNEVGIWIPVESSADGGLCAYSPYVWIDSSTSTIGGRGIYGYTKQTAKVNVLEVGQASEISVIADAMIAEKGGGMRIEPTPILTVTSAAGAPWAPPTDGFASYLDLVKMAADAVRLDFNRLRSLLDGMRSVFLKQLPHIDGVYASYQAIVEARIVPALDTLRGKILSTPWTVSIPTCHTPNIVDRLGLRASLTWDRNLRRNATIQSLAPTWLRFEGRLEAGVETWRR